MFWAEILVCAQWALFVLLSVEAWYCYLKPTFNSEGGSEPAASGQRIISTFYCSWFIELVARLVSNGQSPVCSAQNKCVTIWEKQTHKHFQTCVGCQLVRHQRQAFSSSGQQRWWEVSTREEGAHQRWVFPTGKHWAPMNVFSSCRN